MNFIFSIVSYGQRVLRPLLNSLSHTLSYPFLSSRLRPQVFQFTLLFTSLFSFNFNYAIAAKTHKDPFYFNYLSLLNKNEKSYDLGAGLPPLRFDSGILANSIAYRKSLIENIDSTRLKDQNLNLFEYKFSSVWIQSLEQNKKMTAGLSLSLNSAQVGSSGSSPVGPSALFSTFFFALQEPTSNPNVKWSYGFVVLNRNRYIPILPSVAVEYETDDKLIKLSVSYPSIYLFYKKDDITDLGGFLYLDSSSYYMNKTDSQEASDQYIYSEKFLAGVFYQTLFAKKYRASLRTGYAFKSDTGTLDGDLSKISHLQNQKGTFISFGLSLVF